MKNIFGETLKDLENYFESKNSKPFHAKQVFKWLYQKKINDIELMTDIKKEMQDKMKRDFSYEFIKIKNVEKDKLVNKYLFELNDHEHIEAVLMFHDYGKSVCISSQVGCNMGCKFCESGRRKKVRDLESFEMVQQLLLIEEDIKSRISHVVIMGIGEPFDNYDNVIKFIEIINNAHGLAIGSRHITVSTCGIIPKIEEFKNFPYEVNLAISLHSADQDLRKSIMPIAKVYPLELLMNSLNNYLDSGKRRITFEYIMLDNINDKEEDALKLVKLIKGMNAYVNLIPYNETDNIQFKRSSTLKITRFYDILKKNNVNVTIRKEFGTNISAACGQLRSKEEEV